MTRLSSHYVCDCTLASTSSCLPTGCLSVQVLSGARHWRRRGSIGNRSAKQHSVGGVGDVARLHATPLNFATDGPGSVEQLLGGSSPPFPMWPCPVPAATMLRPAQPLPVLPRPRPQACTMWHGLLSRVGANSDCRQALRSGVPCKLFAAGGVPLLLLASKQDGRGAVTARAVLEQLSITSFNSRRWRVQACSAACWVATGQCPAAPFGHTRPGFFHTVSR